MFSVANMSLTSNSLNVKVGNTYFMNNYVSPTVSLQIQTAVSFVCSYFYT